MTPLRILSLSNVPLDASSGSGYVVCGFASALSERGHRVLLLGPEHYEPGFRTLRGRAVIHRQMIGMARVAVAEAQERVWDIVELWGQPGWLAARILLASGPLRPLVVLRSNGFEPHCNAVLSPARVNRVHGAASTGYRGWHERRYVAAMKLVDGVIAVSEWDWSWGAIRGVAPEGRLAWIDNPLPGKFLALPGPVERPRTFGFCGGWSLRKGSALLENAVPEVLRRFTEWRFAVLGTPDNKGLPERFPPDVRDRIEVHPAAAREHDLFERYLSTAILLVPSRYESFGLVAAEGMACGCALVATRVGFAAGLVDGEEAELLRETSAVELVERVARLIEDPERRRRIASAGQRRVQSLTWAAALDRLEGLYERWLAVHRGRPA